METQVHPGPVLDILDQEVGQFKNEGVQFNYAVGSMQGWRDEMEDAHITKPELTKNQSLFAVFDGHGGSEVAEYA
jgi:protein phosphatase 1G